jgi:hypothetical protein
MNVRELKTILDHLPDEMIVTVGSFSRGLSHVETVTRQIPMVFGDSHEGPAVLKLEGGKPWYDPEPAFTLNGRFRGAKLLDAQLKDLRRRRMSSV